MKVRLTIDLDLPPGSEQYPDAELQQMLFDAYFNYVPVKHLEDALTALDSKGQCERAGDTTRAATWQLIHDHHVALANVTRNPKFKILVL